jgi:MoaA/NifB/PqqE/SkfB family radical SAM enzyme
MLKNSYTSTGAKFFYHQEAMRKLRNGTGQPIVTHVMLTDVCNHSCAFCSVHHRQGDSLPFDDVMMYLDTLLRFGLKAVILSGGGNPILYRNGGKDFNDVVAAIHAKGLEIGLITNGMPLKDYDGRSSWKTVHPETLDKLTWVRLSLAGLDHEEKECYVPDVAPTTALGFSYVAHDIYTEPLDKAHGKVSTEADLLTPDAKVWRFEERVDELTEQFLRYCKEHRPRYLRLLPNCLEPDLIEKRCTQLNDIARIVNFELDHETVFVQYKPPKAPHACYLGYVHPVLNCDGYVYPCDSCVLNETADHQFANPWRVCHWSEVAKLYEAPIRSLVDPQKLCPGCVFTGSNELLRRVVDGSVDTTPSAEVPEHVNFV